jgi:transcriptional regulator with XRE-family HTH domain
MNKPIPINIRAMREKHGLTQVQFAEKVGYSKSAVEKFEAMGRKCKTLPPRVARIIAATFPSAPALRTGPDRSTALGKRIKKNAEGKRP